MRKALEPKHLEKKLTKALTSDGAIILAGSAAAGAAIASLGTGELPTKLGIPSSPTLTAAQTNAQRLQAGIANVSGSMLVTGSATGNPNMAAAGLGFQAGMAMVSQVPELPTVPLAGCGNLKDLAARNYGVERVDIPDDAPPELKYRAIGDLLTELTMKGAEDPLVQRAAKEITAEAVTDRERVVAIGEWVRDNVRYVLDEDSPYAKWDGGVFRKEPGGSLEVFQEPAQTLATRVGDCDCKSLLVTSLLRSLRIPSFYRLVTQDPTAPDIMTHIYSIAQPRGAREMAVDTSPVMLPEGPEWHPIGWEPESVSSLDIILPAIQPVGGAKPLSGRQRMGH